MFRTRAYLTSAILGCFDLTVTAACHMAVWHWGLGTVLGAAPWQQSSASDRMVALGSVLILWIVLSGYFNLYHSRRLESPFADAVTLLKMGLANWIVLKGFAHLLPQLALTPFSLFRWEAINTSVLVAARLVLRLTARELRRRGINARNVLLVSTTESGNRLADKIEQRAHLGYRIVRQLPEDPSELGDEPRLVEELLNTLTTMAVDDVILALPGAAHQLTIQLALACESRGVNVRIVPDFFPLIQSDMQIYSMDGIPLINVRLYPTEYLRYAVLKRVFDIFASLVILAGFSPFYALIALLVKLSSPGPVHFVQERVGLNGRKFKMLKFRTMHVRTDSDAHWTVSHDPRVTALGRCLRRSSLDEMPQFLNVLKGEMSIVGPRPERPVFLERFRRQVPEYMARHYVKCGITGWAQVNGWRGDTSIPQRVACDLYYIRHWAFALDLKIVMLTLVRAFFHTNAY